MKDIYSLVAITLNYDLELEDGEHKTKWVSGEYQVEIDDSDIALYLNEKSEMDMTFEQRNCFESAVYMAFIENMFSPNELKNNKDFINWLTKRYKDKALSHFQETFEEEIINIE